MLPTTQLLLCFTHGSQLPLKCSLRCNINSGFRLSGALGYSEEILGGDYGSDHFDAFGMGSALIGGSLRRVYKQAIEVLDSNLRGMGLVPSGPLNRMFLTMIAFGSMSQSLKEVLSSIIWVRERGMHLWNYLHPILRRYLRYLCSMAKYWEESTPESEPDFGVWELLCSA